MILDSVKHMLSELEMRSFLRRSKSYGGRSRMIRRRLNYAGQDGFSRLFGLKKRVVRLMFEIDPAHGEDPTKPSCSMGIEPSIINYSSNNNGSLIPPIRRSFLRRSKSYGGHGRMSGFSQLFKIKTSSVFNLAFVTLGIASSTSLFSFTDVIFQSVADHTINGQKEFAIVVPTYNNSRFCIANIESLVTQQYNNYHVYIVNDASTDDTYEKLNMYIIDHACEDLVTLIDNKERIGALANYHAIITSLPDHVIVLNVDGDDWLAHEEVLSTLNRVYDDHDVWLTYGQFRQYPSGEIGFCRPISHDVIEQHTYRKSEWLSTHLRTYYAWLFKRIDVNDLYYDGHFMRACGDRALMYPMLEMCAGHFACINDVLYSYNCANPLADVRVNLKEQQKMCHHICSLKPYAALSGKRGI